VSLADPPGEIVDLRPIRDVARFELAVDLRGEALQPLPPPGDENAAPPSIGQAPCEGGADTTRSTCDHRDRNARSVDCGAVTQDFQGKRGLVLGVANRRSIAWAIAQRLAAGGAKLAFTYQGERIEKGVRELADSVGSPLVTECDVCSDDEVARVLGEAGEVFGGELDLLVHSVAFADARDLEGRFTDTPRDRFWLALDVSAYSLVAAARAAEPLMEAAGGGSILTMTYLGGERVVPHYNVMGVAKAALDASVRYLAWELGEKQIRVNAVSAGPVRTLAARSIAGFPTMEAIVEERSPLRRNIEADDVGSAAAYLLSDEAKNISGTTLYVDGGYHAMGM
jgi:enoyl-[acyl-carrier protein] reductase I